MLTRHHGLRHPTITRNHASENLEFIPKNRVWGFFAKPNKTRPENRCNPLKTRQGNHPAPTKNALGVHFKNYLDHVYAVSNDTGSIIEHYRFSAFGEVEVYSPTGQKLAVSAIDNDVLWNSRRFDGDTGLYYYMYRHYKAELGRWLGRDPIEEEGGLNLYNFVVNRPLNYWDVLGLEECESTGTLLGDFFKAIGACGCDVCEKKRKEERERKRNWDPHRVIANAMTDGIADSKVRDPIFKRLHYNRNKNNKVVPRTEETKLPDNKSLFHQQGTRDGKSNSSHTKHVSKDGHHETVYDKDGKIVTDPLNRGTYNVHGPDKWIGHTVCDVLPYYMWGNSHGDPTTGWERFKRTFGFEGYTGSVDQFYKDKCICDKVIKSSKEVHNSGKNKK